MDYENKCVYSVRNVHSIYLYAEEQSVQLQATRIPYKIVFLSRVNFPNFKLYSEFKGELIEIRVNIYSPNIGKFRATVSCYKSPKYAIFLVLQFQSEFNGKLYNINVKVNS